MNREYRLRLLSNVVIIYMLLAFTWWSVLLYSKNKDTFSARSESLQLLMINEGSVNSEQEFLASPAYNALKKDYQRQELMIFGEAAVFVITLIIGVWLINRGYHKQIRTARQQRNFLLSITHELKSPISSLRLILETIGRRKLPLDTQLSISQKGLREADRLNNLVNNLLLAARMETTYQPTFEALEIRPWVNQMLQESKNLYPEAKIETKISEELPTHVDIDPSGLRSVVTNLIENAVKYSKPPAEIQVKLFKKAEYMRIEICDQGQGIPDREKEQVFERFYRIGNEDTRKTKGTGLGLFIVNNTIKAHKGNVTIRDNTPTGTCFVLGFPIKHAKEI